MSVRNSRAVIAAACLAAMAGAGLVRAGDTPTAGEQGSAFTLSQPLYATVDASAPRRPLMTALDQVGLGPVLDENGITITGYVEAGWTYNFASPNTHFNNGRVFDVEDQDLTLNQVDVSVQRAVTASSDQFDWGGKMEWIWGGDARFIHANGLYDSYGGGPAAPSRYTLLPGTSGPDEQFDPVQFYLQFNVPVGNGLLVTGGKFVSGMGYESIDATQNPLYSHSLLFGFATPFTFTGVKASYAIDSNWSVTGAVVRGWDQSFEDVNNMVSFVVGLAYTSEKLDFRVTGITGPEQVDEDGTLRTLADAVLIWRENEQLTLAVDAAYGWEPESGIVGGPSGKREDGVWWGAAGYLTYKFNDMFTGQARLEYFSDHKGSRGLFTEITEVTVGLNIRPMPNDQYGSGLVIRPEVRWDYANDDFLGDLNAAGNALSDNNQFTFGIDAIYAF